jgi:hypothetical protein
LPGIKRSSTDPCGFLFDSPIKSVEQAAFRVYTDRDRREIPPQEEGECMRKAAVLVSFIILFTTLTSGVSAQKGNYWMAIPLDVCIPTGDLSEVASTGWGIGFGIGYWITNSWLIDGQFSYHNFGEKKVGEGVKVNGGIVPIELGVAYMFMKDSKYRPYLTLRTGFYSYQSDFRGELGEKSAAGGSFGIGLAILSGYEGRGMLFIEPNIYTIHDDKTYNYWTVNFGVAWNLGG